MTTARHRGRAAGRRRLGRSVLVPLLVVGALLCSGCLADWSQVGYSAAGTRASSDDGISSANLATMAPDLAGVTGGAIYSSPAVAAGMAYVTSDDGRLDAFDATGASGCGGLPVTCSPRWTASIQPAGALATAGVVSSSPAVSSGRVYVGTTSGTVDVFDATGTTGCSGTPKVCTPLWTATVAGAIDGSPTVSGSTVYVGSTDGTLSAFDAAGATGCSGTPKVCTPLWTATVAGAIEDTPAVAGNAVYVGSTDGTLHAFTTSGTPAWTATAGGSISTSSPAVSGNAVYVGSTDGRLYAFTTSGAPSWSAPTGSPISSSPAVTDDAVYVGSTGGQLYDLSLNGTVAWTATTGGPILSSPAVANGLVYVGSTDGQVTAYDAAGVSGCSGTPTTCTARWTATTGGQVVASVAVAQGAVWYASLDHDLYAQKPWVAYPASTCAANPYPGLSPCQLQHAYELPSLVAGQGRTVAIVDAYDDPKAESDLATYRAQWGLPACTTANGCFRKLNQSGAAKSYPSANKSWSEEISLDVDTVSAICPWCHITLVEATSASLGNLLTAEQAAAATGPTVLSNSWGAAEFSGESSYDGWVTYAGIPVTFSTGDGGYGPQWPAAASSVTAVGGTVLTASDTYRGWTESAWSGAGSGCSSQEAKPAWQTDPGCTRRTIADVSALAGSPGEELYDSYGGDTGWEQFGGTSLASPIVASVYALAYPDTTAATTYGRTSTLFDVTSGSNGSCSGSYLCTATTGYDGPTGLGTPCGTASFGSGPYATASDVCAALVTVPTTATTTAGAHAQGRSLAPTPVLVPVCGTPAPGQASCDADRIQS